MHTCPCILFNERLSVELVCLIGPVVATAAAVDAAAEVEVKVEVEQVEEEEVAGGADAGIPELLCTEDEGVLALTACRGGDRGGVTRVSGVGIVSVGGGGKGKGSVNRVCRG